MEYAIEMHSGAMIYVHTKCHEDRFRLSEVKGAYTYRHIESEVIS
jgi:hypothetical protein